jgi:hypothetical protein
LNLIRPSDTFSKNGEGKRNKEIMRGIQRHLSLFEAPHPQPLSTSGEGRFGRDVELLAARNRLLLHRYYWHSIREPEPGVRMNFESLMNILSNEFFLSKNRIAAIIETNTAAIRKIRLEHEGLIVEAIGRKFGREWSFIIW